MRRDQTQNKYTKHFQILVLDAINYAALNSNDTEELEDFRETHEFQNLVDSL